jgi:hypothetical protein
MGKHVFNVGILIISLGWAGHSYGQTGPFNPEQWPPTSDTNKAVHFISTDEAFTPLSASWIGDPLQILSGGDQVTAPVTIGGHTGVRVAGTYLNVADTLYDEWADNDTIDILMQVYGNAALLAGNGSPRDFAFLTGTLPELNFPVGGQLPVESKNNLWNWVLFRITNGVRASDGSRFVGSIPANAQGDTRAAGVNGGTIRTEGVGGLIVRLVAFGERGAFGEPEQINVFATGEACEPEPPTNLASIDISTGATNHLVVLNNGDQTVVFQDNVGPAGDQRRAVRAEGSYINFGITDNYLGRPCNDPKSMKICLEFFDDPALAGAIFGPEAYATDSAGGTATFPVEQRHTLQGTGAWLRRSFTVPLVNLLGTNTAPLTGGPRLVFENGKVFISRFDLGIFRTGTNALAGQDPLAGCVEDPNICTTNYANFVELDLDKDIKNGLDVGTSGGDQLMVVEEAGPAADRRQAVRADGTPGIYVNFALTENALGPVTQDNAHLAICVTYYDDPALAGTNAASLRPEVYQTFQDGQLKLAFTDPAIAVTLQGTDQWRDAYFEIADIRFNGVNQGPQAAARFLTSNGQVHLTRVRYAVIRPCGPLAGINQLEDCKPKLPLSITAARTADSVSLQWPGTGSLQTAPTVLGPWTSLTNAVSPHSVLLNSASQQFFRVAE